MDRLRKKKFLYIGLGVVALIIIYRLVVFVAGTGKVDEKTAARKIPVKAVAARKMVLFDRIKLTGDIVGTEVVNVFSQVPGKVQVILIKEGQKVYRGMTLFKINRDIVGMSFMPAIVESPITGYVGSIMVDRGMAIAPTIPLAQVVNMRNVEAVVNIMEKDINRVKIGMEASVRVKAFPDKIFKGVVYKKSAVLDSASRTQEVKILLRNPGLKLKHGMFADVNILIGMKQDAIVVPEDSIMLMEDGTKYVFVVNNKKPEKRTITTGITAEHYTEVLSGLEKDEIIVTLGKENIKTGSGLIIYREDLKKGQVDELADSPNPPEKKRNIKSETH